ncbi:hypothetical protein FEF26_12710 [Nesterenkonia salmonea]|uniref:Integrase n=1 Tax=Nesterenkonia salmonea TaxID=1804987 RepID=A0A5R9B854_9MICC|nr:hypothetical protein [Nesterenkonia salmonea]TLP93888.1 hypothetical protein FEF26_12710 [Nesterenkonia salmonea]
MHASQALISGYLDGTVTLGSRSRSWWVQARAWAIDQGFTVPEKVGVTAAQGEAWKAATDWVPRFDRGDVRAACFIVISYLTGMRPQEVLHLERDCLSVATDSDPLSSTVTRYRIRARSFKNVRDSSGNSIGSGRERKQPWVTIAPTAEAIEALKTLNPEERYLFALLYKGNKVNGKDRQRRGDVVSVDILSQSFERLVTKWNKRASHDNRRVIRLFTHTGAEVTARNVVKTELRIPESDVKKSNTVSPSQFRRTLAWHIANQPGGEVALGVQYGHLKTVISLGYAGRGESGFPDELELDELLANWDQVETMTREVGQGSTISGPAAPRVRESLSQFTELFEGKVQTEAELKRLSGAGLHPIYNNPRALNICAYNSALALCHPDRQEDTDRLTPDLDNCQRGCPNIAMLDSHAGAKAAARLDLIEESQYLPLPLAERSRTIAANLQRDIDRHHTAQSSKPQALSEEEPL